MPPAVAILILVLLVLLAGLFVHMARSIRRDFNTRFDRLQARLERDAEALVRDVLD